MTRFPSRLSPALCLALSALTPLGSGCATFSAIAYSTGRSPAFDERAEREDVPQPGIRETLTVTLHAAGLPAEPAATSSTAASTTAATAATTSTAAPAEPAPLDPPVLECRVSQEGENIEYTAATHYGTRWKLATAAMFLIEAGLATAYLVENQEKLGRYAAGGYFAADAAGTFALFWVPERDVFKSRHHTVVTEIRDDCPAGLVLEIEGRTVTVDAAGKLSPLGPQLLTRAVTDSAAPIAIRLGARSTVVELSGRQRCEWAQSRRASSRFCRQPTGLSGPVQASLDVPPGALTASW